MLVKFIREFYSMDRLVTLTKNVTKHIFVHDLYIVPYMTKPLRKAIMIRSSLKNKLYKNFTPNNSMAYKKQRNYCSRLYKKERKKYYEKLNVKKVMDNKEFWKTVKPFLSDRRNSSSKDNTSGRG